MGLSCLPTPSEGVLTLLLVNTAISIAILKEIARSFLHVLGLLPFFSSPDPRSDHRLEPYSSLPSEPTLTDRFRSRFKPVRFGSAFCRHADCRVCLTRFEPESVVNRLPCGHLFHKACVEKWLEYHHITCPLCRTRLLPADDTCASTSAALPWF